jgi:hypothetical protein
MNSPIALELLVGGAASMALGGVGALASRRRRRRGVLAQAEVTRHEDDADGFTPVLRFVAADGATYEFSPTTRVAGEDWSVGRRVEVVYKAGDPGDVEVNTRAQRFALPVALAALGALLVAVGAALLLAIG